MEPSFDDGVRYWSTTEASVDGVLGGFGPKTVVPRLDATASRLLLLSLLPELSIVASPHSHYATAIPATKSTRSYRALDAGAGIGRITSTVLLPLFHRIDLVEPTPIFLVEAEAAAKRASEDGWKQLRDDKSGRGVRIWEAGLQFFDPRRPGVPVNSGKSRLAATLLSSPSVSFPSEAILTPASEGYDIIMIQWCVGHLSDRQLIDFLKRSQAALRTTEEKGVEGFVVVKENTCKDTEVDGKLFDDEDSSITRSDSCFKRIFEEAGMKLIREEVQRGFPKEIFPVKSYVLR